MSVCLSARITRKPNFCACCPWLVPPVTALQYVMYFRFYRWRHVFYHGTYRWTDGHKVVYLLAGCRWRSASKQSCCPGGHEHVTSIGPRLFSRLGGEVCQCLRKQSAVMPFVQQFVQTSSTKHVVLKSPYSIRYWLSPGGATLYDEFKEQKNKWLCSE